MLTVTKKNPNAKKYIVTVDLAVLEKIAGALGLFQPQFMKDLNESLEDAKAKRFVRAKSLKNLR